MKNGKYIITVYAICKNESKFVKRWLDSMQEADHIVVLDTGSTDNTYDLLKNDTRVTRVEQQVFTPWRFDAARNASLALVPDDTDICICTDLDEILSPGWAEAIRDEWQPEAIRGYYKYTLAGDNVIWYNKIHIQNYTWSAPVHEFLVNQTGKDESSHGIWFSDKVHLYHYPDSTKSRGLYLGLLELRVQETPDDVDALYYLAREYEYHSRDDDAIDVFEKLLEMPNAYRELKAAAYLTLGYIYKRKKDTNKAVYCFTKSIDTYPDYKDPYLALAELYNEQSMYNMAIITIEAANVHSRILFNWMETYVTHRGRAEDILSIAYYYLGDKEKSKYYYDIALSYDPENERLKYNGQFYK